MSRYTCDRLLRASLSSVLFLLAVACQGDPLAVRQAAITDGVPWTGHPSVGIVRGNGHFCTATLVGVKTVLTAAHCVPEDSGFAFEAEGASYEVSRVIRHPEFVVDPQTISDHDIALLALATAPPVQPSTVNTTPVTVGLEITLVGYGKTGNSAGYLGDKHMATNVIDQVAAIRFRFSGSDADSGIGGTCLGDSGGPAFASPAGQEVVAGVVSSSSAECGVFTWDTRVDAYESWLITASGGDLHGVATPPLDGGTADQAPPIADSGAVASDSAVVLGDLGTLDAAAPTSDLSPLGDGSGAGEGSPATLSGGGCTIGSELDPSAGWVLMLLALLLWRRRSAHQSSLNRD